MTFFINWAGPGNYSSGPDSGFPIEVDSGARFFTPGFTVPAETLNFILGTLSREAQTIPSLAIHDWAALKAVGGAGGISPTFTQMDSLFWDDVHKMWVAAGHSSPGLSYAPDDGNTWLPLTTSGATLLAPAAVGPLPNGTGFTWQGIGAGVTQFVSLTGVVTSTTSSQSLNATGGVAFPHTGYGGVVAVVYDSDATRQRAVTYRTIDGTTLAFDALPTTWHNVNTMPAMSFFTSAAGPAQDQLVVFGGTTPVTNPSMLLHITWNGSAFTYTDVSAAMPIGMSNLSLKAVAYNATDGLWGVLGDDGTNTAIYTSPDLVTWTSHFLTQKWGGLVCVGPYWVSSQPWSLAGVVSFRAVSARSDFVFTPLPNTMDATIFSLAQLGRLSQGYGNAVMWGKVGAQATKQLGA
jgi:hypothetical protein